MVTFLLLKRFLNKRASNVYSKDLLTTIEPKQFQYLRGFMEVSRADDKPLTDEDMAHLKHLKTVVEKALENGAFSVAQIDQIKSIIWADGKVTYEELHTISETIKEVMGDDQPGLEWLSYQK